MLEATFTPYIHTKNMIAPCINDINIQSRVNKGLGNVTRIMNILDKVTLGNHYFKTAMLLRESILISALLTNAESWHGLNQTHANQLESIDKLLLKEKY